MESAAPPKPKEVGIMARMVVRVVIRMGRSLPFPESTRASIVSIPLS